MSTIRRRDFLKSASIALTGAALLREPLAQAAGHIAGTNAARRLLGMQLYTVRDDMKKDPSGTLRQLSAMGYRHVEHANYIDRKFYGYSVTDFKNLVSDLGLNMSSGHTVLNMTHWDASKNDFTDVWKWTIDDAATLGQRYLISPWLDESLRTDYDGLLRFLDIFNKSGQLCKSHGLQFGYHNHDFEFKTTLNGQSLYDILLAHMDRSLVAQQLDIGNMYGGGAKPLDILAKYPGRFELMHVKDVVPTKGGEMGEPFESCVLGTGILGTKQVLDVARRQGTTQFIIEEESYQGDTPLDCCQKDYTVMKGWGY